MLKNSFIILSGSNATDLHHQAERLPGRRGEDPYPDKVMLPLNFAEFVNLIAPDIPKLDFNLRDLMNDLNLARRLIKEDIYAQQLKKLYNVFRLTGGFLNSINSYYRNQEVSELYYQTYLQWIKGDINKLGRSENITRQICAEVTERLVSKLDWQALSKNINDLKHHSSLVEYIKLLDSFFITKTLYQIDIHKKTVQSRKQKKVYFIDHFILWTLISWNLKLGNSFDYAAQKVEDTLFGSKLAESFILQQLLHIEKATDYMNSKVFFWHANKEIDFIVVNDQGNLVPVEVKYQNKVDLKDFTFIKKQNFSQGLIFSKNYNAELETNFYCIADYMLGLLSFE
jgi:predicted AAA+ superfamily ATPase